VLHGKVDATTGAIDPNFAPVMDNEVESLAVAPDGLHVFAGGRFTKIDGVAQKSLAKLRLSDGARISSAPPCSTPTCATWTSRPTAATS